MEIKEQERISRTEKGERERVGGGGGGGEKNAHESLKPMTGTCIFGT